MTTEKDTHVGRFYGVYLLCSESQEKRYKGKCYIGFTVNPNRRIKQHNRGKDFGGAHKTNNKGPWKMVMIVHGFPNNIAALQFEWAWQQPMLSSRLKIFEELKRKNPKESYFEYNFRILSRMLNVGPWCRLPLNVRWLELAYKRDFDYELLPPRHMRIISSGAIVLEKRTTSSKTQDAGLPRTMLWAKECHLCMQSISNPERSRMGCLNPTCKLTCHIICLSNHFIASDLRNRGHFIPIAGECPLCERELTWIELLQYKNKMQGGVLCEDDEAYADDEEIELEVDLEMSSDALSSDDDNDELTIPKTNDYCKLSTQKHVDSFEILQLSD